MSSPGSEVRPGSAARSSRWSSRRATLILLGVAFGLLVLSLVLLVVIWYTPALPAIRVPVVPSA